jgi:hypothetical protein
MTLFVLEGCAQAEALGAGLVAREESLPDTPLRYSRHSVRHGCDFSRGILPFTMGGAVEPQVA